MNPIVLGAQRELFVDHHLIECLDNAHLKLHEPVSGGVAIKNDKPWEGPANFGMSVIDVGDRLLMYYRGWALTDAADQNGVGCVAESRDGGVTWTKPALNRARRPDWPDNNIIATADGEPRFAFPCAPWVDPRPGVPADERIKMVQSEPVSGEKHTAMRDPKGPKRLVFWASADGFASVNAPWAGGELGTKPFTFTGRELELNYRTGAPGFVRVEIRDVVGAAIPGFTLDDCPELIGDEIERVVAWKGGADVSCLAGQPVRLHVAMKDADLFALRFR